MRLGVTETAAAIPCRASVTRMIIGCVYINSDRRVRDRIAKIYHTTQIFHGLVEINVQDVQGEKHDYSSTDSRTVKVPY